ncbi:hypothetical protein PT974_10276 [Cladobotryum mycophilum]|uniref:LysM domain-containing protein n=1 Tax=Cladobotryum mycophilum TaxID=491253 RepID=A0ABR0SAB3_9HYPO
MNCKGISEGKKLCLPLTCEKTYSTKEDGTCYRVEHGQFSNGEVVGAMICYNPWADSTCSNLVTSSDSVYGRASTLTSGPPGGSGGSLEVVPPSKDAKVAEGTTDRCARWYTVDAHGNGEATCANIRITVYTRIDLLMAANPSLGKDASACSSNLKPGLTYCSIPSAG